LVASIEVQGARLFRHLPRQFGASIVRDGAPIIKHEVERPALVGSCGIAIGAGVPNARFRPPRLRTVNRSSRYSRYTYFFRFMPLPSRRSWIASRR